MQKEKAVNLAWVIVLVPIIMQIYGAIKATMESKISSMAMGIIWHLLLMVCFAAIPIIIGKKME
jgi:hypothetical protein